MIALPDGEAELRVTLRLQWEDVAALGQEAGRLAARWKRAVSLDEAASHRLRGRPTTAPAPATPAPQERANPQPAVAASSVSPLPARSSGEHARQAIEKITGGVGHASA
ncbi:hypothetical protein B1H19_37190 [Streptomyces gilvosporeus]|uniref:Uncharacterized protein n=1 Tax=Streptomyces gilvosporeus TaxID=553510 RepID=A0A1V0U4L1_9ACTN|nr:hypothetical protein B1H19_37190 [Streptomyces gilvosporeus]